jgi:hypothetical protein
VTNILLFLILAVLLFGSTAVISSVTYAFVATGLLLVGWGLYRWFKSFTRESWVDLCILVGAVAFLILAGFSSDWKKQEQREERGPSYSRAAY